MISTIAHPAFAGDIGAAEADITPPPGIYARMWGAAAHDVAAGVHRPLMCSALVLRADGESSPLALIGVDLGWFESRDDERSVREGVLEALGVDETRVIVSLSHTHSGPSICRAHRDRAGGHLIDAYVESVRAAAAGCARRALAASRPATLTWEHGTCALARDRDLPDPTRARVLCGFNPAAANDRTVLVGRATGEDGRAIATVVNYACHPTSLAWQNNLISPDYVGAARQTVVDATGAPMVFLQGASGDLGPREQYAGDPAIADANGRQLGLSVLATLAAMLPPRTALAYAGAVESGAPLATWGRCEAPTDRTLDARRIVVPLALKDLPSAAEIDQRLARCEDRVQRERLRRAAAVRRTVGEGAESPWPAWIWRLGGAFLVAQPNEAYSQLQVELRRRHPDAAIAVMNVANGGSAGYLPPRERYAQDLYQVWQTPFAAGGLERLIDACSAAITDLTDTQG
ncbi:MAG TPA: neutral/alkaline non-lysosomal ceramidase N-terminal domain-containing protein [Planctomycetota bacterium]|nr:neutral/alkaline non-lysosomal ceramidase N-terminal domain-containing protein [Planctomycetota bacterium]